MFGLGFTEILLIAVVALLFIGPDKLPDTMKTIARTLGKVKRALDDTKATLEQELRVDDLRAEVMQYRAELDKAKSDLSSFKNIAAQEVDSIKQSAQIENNFKPNDINDDKLFDDLFEDADSDFEALEKDLKEPKKEKSKSEFKNIDADKKEAKRAEVHNTLVDDLKNALREEESNQEPQEQKITGFKHLDKKDT